MAEFKVNTQSAAVAKMAKDGDWPLIDALIGGTLAMRKAGETYLPKFPSEEQTSYDARLKGSVLFPAFTHTASVLSSKPFARPMKLENVPADIEPYLDNVDMLGTEVHGFSGQIMLACLQKGIHGVLVDMPPSTARTAQEERQLGIRPYWTHYPANSILGWRAQRNAEGTGAYLTQLRLMEVVTEPEGDWGENIVEQVRVLAPGRWETWREQMVDGEKKWVKIAEGVTTIDFIPFVFFYGLRKDFGIGESPMLHLAHMNVEHWQSASDQRNIEHAARVPILFAKGFEDDAEIKIGASQAVTTSNTDGDLKYVEHTGKAIEVGRTSIKDLEDRMRQAGAELLVQRPAITTATQVESEDEANRSILQDIAEEFDESMEALLTMTAKWVKASIAADGIEVEVYKDFASANLGEKGGNLLLSGQKAGVVSKQTTFEQFKRQDVLPHDADWEEEQKRLKAEQDEADKHEDARADAEAARAAKNNPGGAPAA